MQNYHRHSCYSNLSTPDSIVFNADYAKRAKEIGHKIISSVEHGWAGNYFETYDIAKANDLKFVFGAEAYWVKDRLREYDTGKLSKKGEPILSKDRSNHHIVLLAKSEQGRQSINDIISEANLTGYFYKPRVDLELLMQLPKDDVLVTSACVAFDGYDDVDDIILQLHSHFDKNFLLEVQYHNTDKQKQWNKHLVQLSAEHNIGLIVGLDSHYIMPEDAQLREWFIEDKGIHYEDEEGWYMDYPDDDETVRRFEEQGVLSHDQIVGAMNNTDLTSDFVITIKFLYSIKISSCQLYFRMKHEQKKKSVIVN